MEVPGEVVARMAFFEAVEKDVLRLRCNGGACTETFFEGKDYKLPDDWMVQVAKHVIAEHKEELDGVD